MACPLSYYSLNPQERLKKDHALLSLEYLVYPNSDLELLNLHVFVVYTYPLFKNYSEADLMKLYPN